MLDSSGAPADACPRNFCESALETLETETGLTLWTAFEHEFTVTEAPFRLGAVFSVEALRLAARFAHDVTEAMRPVGLECFEPEFGKGQFEVSCAPLPNTFGPDRAILAREVVREIARRLGIRVTFSPKPILEGAGSGMHVHFSFRDRSGRPATHDPLAPGTVTAPVASFIAGVMRHIGAVTAVSAPAPVSYLRLGPAHWSCGYAAFGVQNREAALRLCPSPDRDSVAAAEATNIELRIPDGTANPYLVVGMLALAGLSGVRARLPLPPIVEGDPARLNEAERAALGVSPLPESLGAALDALEADTEAWNWMPPRLRDTFVAVKRMEVERFAGAEPHAVASAYREIY
jgi:glutamine synthetase